MEPGSTGMHAERSTAVLHRLEVRRLAVFRALQLGDMLCAVPALRALRAALPRTHITLIGLPWARAFAERFRIYVDDFIAFPGHPDLPEQPVRQDQLASFHALVRASRFDLALQLHGSGQISNAIVRGFGARAIAGYCSETTKCGIEDFFLHYPDQGHEAQRLLDLVSFLGAPGACLQLEFPLTAADESELRASGLAADLEPGAYFCIHPGARAPDRRWPPQHFADVADRLCEEFGLRAVITGSEAESALAHEVVSRMRHVPVNAAAPISVGAMAALMSRARLLVCNDTGVSHIAAALRLPSVVVFSKSDMERWAPLDATLHRCVWDPDGQQVAAALAHARLLLR